MTADLAKEKSDDQKMDTPKNIRVYSGSAHPQLSRDIADYLNTAFFKAYRYVNAFDGESLPQVFSTPDSCFAELCDIKMKKCESHLRSRNYKKELAPKMSPEFLQKEYPKLSPALFSLLHSVSEQLEDEMK